MLKGYKIAALIAAAAGTLYAAGCGLGGFPQGLLAKGFIDNWYIDAVTDWLMEDLFVG